MITRVLPADDADALREGAELLRRGELVAFPTETVYGLGADARRSECVSRIFEAKGRPGDNPLIVHISDMEQLPPLVAGGEISDAAMKLARAFWPGPLTIIFPRSALIPDRVTGGLDTVAIRMPSHPAARELIRLSGCPVAAPSANRSGRPSPTLARHVLEDMDGRIPLILDGGACDVGVESTVVALDGDVPCILRPGGITPEMLEGVLGSVRVDKGVMSPIAPTEKPRSPGMKYRHYAPNCRVRILRGNAESAAREICRLYDEAEGSNGAPLILCETGHAPLYGARRLFTLGDGAGEAAHALFDALREADERGAGLVLAEGFAAEGVGLAVMNRLGRAAAFDITEV